MSRLRDLLAESFPTIANSPPNRQCIVSAHFHDDRPELHTISSAIEAIEREGGTSALVAKLRREHPLTAPHNVQHDERAFDVLTEACAFAWAIEVAHFPTPQFTTAEGAPDIACGEYRWIEAKSIHASARDKELSRHLLETGSVTFGNVVPPGPGLFAKFESAFQDAVKKFRRQDSGKLTVFFNLLSVDMLQIPIRDKIARAALAHVEALAEVESDTAVTVCYAFEWQRPIEA